MNLLPFKVSRGGGGGGGGGTDFCIDVFGLENVFGKQRSSMHIRQIIFFLGGGGGCLSAPRPSISSRILPHTNGYTGVGRLYL